MSSAPFRIHRIRRSWNWFFYDSLDPTICGIIRIAYALLVVIWLLVLFPDLAMWFSESGVLSYAASRKVIDPDTLTVFAWLPKTLAVLWACYAICLTQAFLLLVGYRTRFQALCVFVWLVSFQHRNLLLFDGEDVVFRLLGFLLIFFPSPSPLSVDSRRNRNRLGPAGDARPDQCWALRLVQIQMTLIYLSTVWLKFNGEDWLDGTAMFYVSRLDDLFGRFPVPEYPFQHLWTIRLLTWSVLAIELVVPFALWLSETRRAALLVAIGFHLAVDYTMNLFLFQWIMIVGLLSFVDRSDLQLLRRMVGARNRKKKVQLGLPLRNLLFFRANISGGIIRGCPTDSGQPRITFGCGSAALVDAQSKAPAPSDAFGWTLTNATSLSSAATKLIYFYDLRKKTTDHEVVERPCPQSPRHRFMMIGVSRCMEPEQNREAP